MFCVRSLYLMALAALLLMAVTLTAPLFAQDQPSVPLSAYAELVEPGIWVSVSIPDSATTDDDGGTVVGPCFGPGCTQPPASDQPVEIRLVIDPADFCSSQP